jgi:hypothetical protein
MSIADSLFELTSWQIGTDLLRSYRTLLPSDGTENQPLRRTRSMPGNIFYIIGVIVVVLFILGYLGLR